MQARADESLYVETLLVDYVGARNAGMEAVLLDVAGPTVIANCHVRIAGTTRNLAKALGRSSSRPSRIFLADFAVKGLRC